MDKNLLRPLINKMKHGKTESLELVSEMVKSGGDAGIVMITDLTKNIKLKGVLPAELELSTIISYKGKGNVEIKLKGNEIKRSDLENS